MTTEEAPKAKRGRPKKAAAESSSCGCEAKITALEATVARQATQIELLQKFDIVFNTFLQQSMISNTADPAAEQSIQDIVEEIQDSKD